MISKESLFELARALEGVPIVGCLRGTPAALAGVRYGDILLTVNGRRTRNFADYIEAKALRADGISIVLFRAGEERPIELEYHASREAPEPTAILAELIAMRIHPGEPDGSGPIS